MPPPPEAVQDSMDVDPPESGPLSKMACIDSILDVALPQLAFAAERGQLTHSQIHKLHSFVEAIRNAPAYENAFPPPVSLSRVVRGDVSPQLQSFFCRLPNEIIVEIICLLAVEDILTLRTTCKHLYSLSRLRYVWHLALHRHVVHAGLPVPSPRTICGPRYRSASSLDLELRAVHAARLHANLTSDGPQIKRAVQLHTGAPLELDPDAEPLPRRLTSVRHIVFCDSSHGLHYLVAAFSMDCLGCWEISPDSGNIFHVAQWQSAHGTITRVMVNENLSDSERHGAQDTIAVACMGAVGLTVTILVLDKFRGIFVEIGCVLNPNSSFLHAFRGDLLAFSEDSRVMHWREGFSCRLQSQMDLNMLSMHFIDDNFLLTVSDIEVDLFLVPTVQAPLTQSMTHPIASFTFPIPTYEATLSGYHPQAHGTPMSDPTQRRRHPVSLLLRSLESGFDVVYHYVFDLEPHQADGRAPSRPVRFPPTLARTIHVSPSCANIYLGPSGRGYWLETRNIASKRRSYPARCVIPLCITSTSSRDVFPSLPEEWFVELKVGSKFMYGRQCGLKDLKDGKQSVSAVAFDDSVGRMAVGDVEGGIVVLDYA